MTALAPTDRLVTRPRMRVAAVSMIAAMLAGLVYLIATAQGTVDSLDRPIGTDFSNVWTAGWMANHGDAPRAWDWPSHHAVQAWLHGDPHIPFYGWHYPPPFLIVASLLARLPYVAALLVWQGLTFALALMLVRQSSRRRRGVSIEGDGRLRAMPKLPFAPTGAQRRAIGEIEGDMAQATPMLRLLAAELRLDGGCSELSSLPTYDPRIRKLLGDLTAADCDVSESDIRTKLEECAVEARRQFMSNGA